MAAARGGTRGESLIVSVSAIATGARDQGIGAMIGATILGATPLVEVVMAAGAIGTSGRGIGIAVVVVEAEEVEAGTAIG